MKTTALKPIPLSTLANYLIQDGLLDLATAEQATRDAALQSISFLRYFVKNAVLASNVIANSCAMHTRLPLFDLDNITSSSLRTDILSPELIRHHRALPLNIENNTLLIGLSDPTDQRTLDAIRFHTGLNLAPVIVHEDKLEWVLQTYLNETNVTKNSEIRLLHQAALQENKPTVQENSVSYDEPVVRFVDYIIQHAIDKSASDIHIEPYEKNCRIRYRQDGILYETAEIPINLATRIATRLKVMAKLDMTERRLPQDGRFHAHNIDIRINSCPTLFGEKIVLRLLDSTKASLDMDALGFTASQKRLFLEKISQPQGLILVTGPTGSGKTVTLYSALKFLNTCEKNISTVEDPVEIQLDGINQVHVNPKINLHFSTVLRSFLRQDPDVIMVGEIRDADTAEIAIQAAQTGHLVLSTLHTNSALETIARLQSMGVPTYNLRSAVTLIIAQRLLRKLCQHCKKIESITSEELSHLGFTLQSEEKIYYAVGCQHCQQGYQGRIGIYELLPITDVFAKFILPDMQIHTALNHLKKAGYITLREAAFDKVCLGITSLAEMNRVTLA